MPLAKTYSPNPQAQKNADVGPTPYQQMSSAFVNASVNPQLKAFQYTVLSAVKGTPLIGNLYHGFEYLTDPIGELKKDLNISPTISGSIGEAIISHSVAGAAKIFAVGLGAASGGQISNSLVQNAITYEWANQAVAAKRNPAKFIVQTVWNNLAKGDILDHFIYDKTYLFYKAEDKAGERFARWRNNGLFEDFNRRAEKYGVRLEGAEQKMGAYSFTSVLTDKQNGLTPYLKVAKVGWQIGVPSAAAAVFFPPALPFVFGWQLINADWEQFVKKTPFLDMFEARRRIDSQIREKGQFNGKQNSSGQWKEGGDRIDWHGTELPDGKIAYLQPKDKIFRTASDFFTLRGWYRTFVTGETLKDRAFHFGKWGGHDPSDLKLVSFSNVGKDRFGNAIYNVSHKKLFYNNPHGDGWNHVGWHKGTNSKIYEKAIRLSNGEMRVRMYKDNNGVWQFAKSIGQDSTVSKFWQGAYNVQQFGKTIVSRFGIPAALTVALPNPITYAFLGYSAFKGVGEILAPLKFLGWKVEGEMSRLQMIKNLAGKLGPTALGKVTVPFGLVMYENGNSFFRRLFRRGYSILNPFDRDVGILRGILEWRDAQWAKFLSEHTRIGKVLELAERIPFAGALFRTGGFLLGGIKWVVSPGQAIKDKIVQFVGWTISKGVRWALGKAFRAWFSRPLARWLQSQIIKLPAGSLRRRLFDSLLRRIAGHIPLPKLPGPQGFFGRLIGKILSPVTNLFKKLISRIIRFIFDLIKRILLELVKAVVRVVAEGVKAVFNMVGAATAPILGPVVAVILGAITVVFIITVAVILIVVLAAGFLSSLSSGQNVYQSPPANEYLEIRKEVSNPKSSGALFAAGETVDYLISYRVKKKLADPIEFEDDFRTSNYEGGAQRDYFDPNSLVCQSPITITTTTVNSTPPGESGQWYGLLGTLENPGDSTEWKVGHCSAKVANSYTEGALINTIVVKAHDEHGNLIAVSQTLYVNGGSPSGWPVEHGCFTQGPNGAFTHQNQQAVDIGSNWGTGFNISSKLVYSTIDGKILRICVEGNYSTNTNSGVCGGYDEGSYFGDTKGNGGFGTYIILKETNTNLSLFYAHLAPPPSSLTEGAPVKKGDVIGYVDTSGYSVGTHLHYAFTRNSGAGMNQPFIPYYVPTCSNKSPDLSCADAFGVIGEPSRVCF